MPEQPPSELELLIDAELVRLDQSGIRVAEICRRMGRRSSSIRGRLLTLARIDARREEANGRS